MPFARKVLWIVEMDSDADEQAFIAHALAAGADTVSIRTSTKRLPSAISRFHQLGKTVWAWRWPGVVNQPSHTHYYALDEANFVANQCIPAGLDGYIVDPESDKAGAVNDWNQKKLAGLAQQFCAIIKTAAKDKPFMFGTTSGCAYPAPTGKPDIPWHEFFSASDTLYPQCYWRWTNDAKHKVEDINGGTPDKAIARGLAAWTPQAMGKPIVPMAGEIDVVTAAEIAAYGGKLQSMNVNEAHFYADLPKVPSSVLSAINAL
jgi:hypothetical protein